MPDQDQKNSSRLRRPKGRDWTLAALDRDLAYRLAYNSEANRWDLVVIGTRDECSFEQSYTTR
jgi:hypothetical protein